jgi:hypothetical protein
MARSRRKGAVPAIPRSQKRDLGHPALGLEYDFSASIRRVRRVLIVESHTVPKRLLKQFAYEDPVTGSLRLWRYEKGRKPYPGASPKTATRIDRHFAHPDNAAKEEELERRLAREIEEPVNQFLPFLEEPGFRLDDEQRRRLTHYITLLFHRSEARRGLGEHLHQVAVQAINQFLANEQQVLTVVAQWTIDQIHSRWGLRERITPELVRNVARGILRTHGSERSRQARYAETIERTFAFFDSELYGGEWRFVRTSDDCPFVLSDAPVATWQRLGPPEDFKFGIGFHEPDVEVVLPLSPRICLHILPRVRRTKEVRVPEVSEINSVQAAFATRACYTNSHDEELDGVLQRSFGKARFGETAFTLWHRDYGSLAYQVLLGGGLPGGR